MSNTQTVECPKCSGRGAIQAFWHRDNGKCYLCGGARTIVAPTVVQQAGEAARCEDELARLRDLFRSRAQVAIRAGLCADMAMYRAECARHVPGFKAEGMTDASAWVAATTEVFDGFHWRQV